jgi:hypothetical protein
MLSTDFETDARMKTDYGFRAELDAGEVFLAKFGRSLENLIGTRDRQFGS